MLDRATLEAARSALRMVARALAARDEPTAAFDHAIEAINNAITPATTDYGSPPEKPCNHGYVDTAEAARILHSSERWMRDLAPRIGGIKVGGRWIIPKASLPSTEPKD